MTKLGARNKTVTTTQSVSEREIRDALLFCLREKTTKAECVQEELRLERGISRIDVAVIGNQLIGYEIKSDEDTFTRFSNQIHSYNRVFDEIYLVCGPRHFEAATKLIPSWWGIYVAERIVESKVQVVCKRPAKVNSKQNSFSLASMLWREEALAMIEGHSSKVSSKASVHSLWEHIATSFPIESIKASVSESLLRRYVTNS